MTLVVTVNGPDSIWLLADRRLSFNKARPPKDDACKVMFLETTDGVAILGYAGLGATSLGTEPADWMSAALRGRKLSLEQSLGVLAEATKKQLPRYMIRMPGSGGPAHSVIATSFVGEEPKLYTIDLVFAPDRKSYNFRYTRQVVEKPLVDRQMTPRLALGGSGALFLTKNRKWKRSLLRIVRAHDRGQVSPHAVSDYLANLNHEVHLGVVDQSVGPRCIVAWRNRKSGFHKGGGGLQFYTGTTRDASSMCLPTIANGMDISALANMLMPQVMANFEAMLAGEPAIEPDKDEINAELARLPDNPDEKLR
ncbi:MAG: hypothetical protein O6944_06820 [Gammaproteobacteria bacterium]|nr:hypothetical protein [Gammaproteobacteria bacterium]